MSLADHRIDAMRETPSLARLDMEEATSLTSSIRVQGLTKRYGPRTVVKDLHLDIPMGVIAGFVGPNGAGKTTTIRMLLGLVKPTSGHAEVLGFPISRPNDYLPRVGALIEGPAFYPTLSGRRNLEVLAALGGTPPARIDEVLRIVDLHDRAADKVRSYSLGMKQRLGIAAALLPDPALLILDEPANGLDPAGILEMRRLLGRLRDRGITIFISSHILSEIEQIAEWILVLKSGELLFHGTMNELLQRTHSWFDVVTEHAEQLELLAALLTEDGYTVATMDGRLQIDGGVDRVGDVNRRAMNAGITLVEIGQHRATLEDTFLVMTEGDSQ